MSAVRKFFGHVAHPMLWLRGVCGGESAYPLAVLFGLNAVDELDRTAFGILLPNIRDEFGLDNTKVLGLVALSSIAALALQVPIAQYADRSRRVPLAIVGALVWATFSGMTGLAGGAVVLTTHRAANAVGAFVGPLSAGMLAYAFGWRVPFLVFVVPTLIFAFLALRLREPVRG